MVLSTAFITIVVYINNVKTLIKMLILLFLVLNGNLVQALLLQSEHVSSIAAVGELVKLLMKLWILMQTFSFYLVLDNLSLIFKILLKIASQSKTFTSSPSATILTF